MKRFFYLALLPAVVVWIVMGFVFPPLISSGLLVTLLSVVFLCAWAVSLRWDWRGYVGTLAVFGAWALFFVISSPHRLERVKAWLGVVN